MAFMYRDMGRTFHEYILHIFCNDWMDCRDTFHALFCLYCCVTDKTLLCNRQNIAGYEAHRFMGFPIINLWGAHFISTFSVFSVMAGWTAGILFMLFFAYTAV